MPNTDLGKAVNAAMRAVEEHNPDLLGVLPKNYTALHSSTIASLLRHINSYTKDLENEVFEEKLAAAHAELRELAAQAAQLESSVDSVLSQLLSR